MLWTATINGEMFFFKKVLELNLNRWVMLEYERIWDRQGNPIPSEVLMPTKVFVDVIDGVPVFQGNALSPWKGTES